MKLSTRLMLYFMGALAAVLIGFSVSLYWLASKYLHRQVDERLEAAIRTLAAAAEVSPAGVEWEPNERSLGFGRRTLEGKFFWRIRNSHGGQLDGSSPDELTSDLPVEELSPAHQGRPITFHDRSGKPWRAMKLTLSAPRDALTRIMAEGDTGRDGRYSHLSISAGLSLEGVETALQTLLLVLASLSIVICLIALVCGGWLCRKAIRSLTEMAEAAHAIGGDQPSGRLPVPSTDDEIGELGRAFNALLDRLQESFERQQRFTGDASHQLRTPLTVIQGNIDLALRQPRTEEEYRRVLSLVRRKSQHMTQIIEALLFLARADAESEQPRLELIEMESWVMEHLAAYQGCRANDIRVEVVDLGPFAVRAQTPLLAELLDNLLDNAAKYSRPGTSIIVRLKHQESNVHLLVEDQGIGIAEDEIPRLFEAFYRSPLARRGGTTGLGLGLSVASRLAQTFGGRLKVESRPGQGSLFTLVLPTDESVVPASCLESS